MKTQYLRMFIHARDPTYLSDTQKSYRSTNTQNLKEIKKEMFNLFNARTSQLMAGGGIIILAQTVIPLLSGLFGGGGDEGGGE